MRPPECLRAFATAIAILALPSLALAQDAGTPDPETFDDLYPGSAYSALGSTVLSQPGVLG